MDDLNITCQNNSDKNNPAVTIQIKGELNANTASVFEQEIKQIFLNQPQDVFLDLTKVTVFVSAAIGSLLLLHDFITRKNFKFKVIAVNEKVKGILSLIGLDSLMDL